MSRIVVVDYGLGNLGSVSRALRWLGHDPVVSDRPEDVTGAGRLVLPGDGAFGYGIAQLEERGLREPVLQFIASGRPFLGICVGMQLLLGESEEFGHHQGLGVIPGRVVAYPRRPENRVKVPHIGWAPLHAPGSRATGDTPAAWRGTILDDVAEGESVYFVHSYLAMPDDPTDRIADSPYGEEWVCAVVLHGNAAGCQFHPEKSGPVGLRILRAFVEGGVRSGALPVQGVASS